MYSSNGFVVTLLCKQDRISEFSVNHRYRKCVESVLMHHFVPTLRWEYFLLVSTVTDLCFNGSLRWRRAARRAPQTANGIIKPSSSVLVYMYSVFSESLLNHVALRIVCFSDAGNSMLNLGQ